MNPLYRIKFTKNYSVNVLYLYKISIQISIKCIREHRILFMISHLIRSPFFKSDSFSDYLESK